MARMDFTEELIKESFEYHEELYSTCGDIEPDEYHSGHRALYRKLSKHNEYQPFRLMEYLQKLARKVINKRAGEESMYEIGYRHALERCANEVERLARREGWL